MTDNRQARMLALLNDALSPVACELTDDSAQHIGHAGAASGAGHYSVRIVAGCFEGKNRVARHRLVYDCLREMMHTDIHALAITALAPSEVGK